MGREPRTKVMFFRVTERDEIAIRKAAKSAGMTESEFMRAAVLTALALEGNPHAWKMLGHGMAETLRDLMSAWKATTTTK